MGKRGERTMKTYGRHRQRVISSDVWNNALGKKEVEKNVFSTSSSMDSLSISHNSTGDSVFQPRKTKNSRNKENPQPVQRRRNLRKLDSSGGDSTSSTCSEGLLNSKSRPRRALRDRSNVNEKESKTYGKRKRGQITALHHYSMCNNVSSASSVPSLYNFSDFDDYSLVISGTPGQVSGNKESFHNGPTFCSPCHLRSGTKLQIETSTPFAKRFQPGTPLTEKMKDGDLSHIDIVNSPISKLDEDNVLHDSKEGSCTDLDKLGISSIVEGSRILTTPPVGQRSNLQSSVQSCGSSSGKSPVDDCMVQLVRLRESFLSLHVSTRSSTREKTSNLVIDNSKSLFSDISLHTDESSTDDNNDENSEESETSEGEEEVALSDIEEDVELEEDSDEIDNDDNSSFPSKSSHNNSTHYMLAEDVEDSKEVDDEEEEDLVEEENEELDEEELEEEENEDQMSNSSYNTADTESQEPSYHTANSTNTTPLRSQVRLRRRERDKQQDLNESIFDVLTPKKCAQSIIEESPHTKVYQVCQQKSHMSFRTCIPDRMMAACTKVGEGVYGEVFRTQNKGKSVALKVIPIEGGFPVNDEPQKTFGEMLPEIVISRELSSLRSLKESYTQNFCQVNRVSCVQGRYPAKLLKEWKAFDKKCQSQNDSPDVFDDEQLFIVFEFADGGRDLESCQFQNIFEAKSALAQVAFSLAVAEETLEFEHRDLHWGNVLVKRTDEPEIHYRLMGQDYTLPSHRVDACLIDFTLSRLRKDGCVVYNDLSTDEILFEGSGDLQFDIYRQMKENNGNNWEPFHPRSNILWLHYLADKLVRSKRYVRNSREDKSLLREFRNFLKDILDYDSACELVTCNEFLKS